MAGVLRQSLDRDSSVFRTTVANVWRVWFQLPWADINPSVSVFSSFIQNLLECDIRIWPHSAHCRCFVVIQGMLTLLDEQTLLLGSCPLNFVSQIGSPDKSVHGYNPLSLSKKYGHRHESFHYAPLDLHCPLGLVAQGPIFSWQT